MRQEWDQIATRKADDVPELLSRLAEMLSAEKGVRVIRADAAAIAVREALASRATGSARSRPAGKQR